MHFCTYTSFSKKYTRNLATYLFLKIKIYNNFCLHFLSWGCIPQVKTSWKTPHTIIVHELKKLHVHAILVQIYAIWQKIASKYNYLDNAITSCRVSFNSSGLKECCHRKGNTKKPYSSYHSPEILALLLTPKPHKAKEKKLVLEKHYCFSLDNVICFD